MAKGRSQRLKVFQAQFGFFDSVVAAPSQAAALRAWGTHQNLFASGEAKVTTDEAATTAALAYPETPLRRAVGSKDAFALEPTSLPKVPERPRRTIAKASPEPEPPRPAPSPPANRSALEAAEAALDRLDEARKREERDLGRRQDEFDAEKARAQGDYVEARKAATAVVVRAREAYRNAGGRH